MTKLPNAYCKKHDEIEPQDHDFFTDGLWICPQCSKENMKNKMFEYGKKIDKYLKQLESEDNDV